MRQSKSISGNLIVPLNSTTAINDLGFGTYYGVPGGLYPLSANNPPSSYWNDGLNQLSHIVPRDGNGNPNPSGKIGVAFLGMSNWFIIIGGASGIQNPSTNGYLPLANDGSLAPGVVLCNAAQFGMGAKEWAGQAGSNPWAGGWSSALSAAGLTQAQVQVVFCLTADVQWAANAPFNSEYLTHATYIESWMRQIRHYCPQCVLAFWSAVNTTYSAFGSQVPNPQLQPPPADFNDHFGLQLAIADQINNPKGKNLVYKTADGPIVAPQGFWHCLFWGPPDSPRSDGFVMNPKMVRSPTSGYDSTHADGVHPSGGQPGYGVETFVPMLRAFTDTHPLVTPWLKKNVSGANAPSFSITINGNVNPASVTVQHGSPFSVSGSAQANDGGTITRYSWNFDDGCCGSGLPVIKNYSSVGTYNFRMAVTSSLGNYTVITIPITVT